MDYMTNIHLEFKLSSDITSNNKLNFLPKEFPYNWLKDLHLFWNEQYILHAFLSYNENFEVLLGNAFLGIKYPDKLMSTQDCFFHWDSDWQFILIRPWAM